MNTTGLKVFFAAEALLSKLAAARAESFTIERGDSRPFCIHSGPDETEATKRMKTELAREIKRVTNVDVEVVGYDLAAEGDFFVATEPWDAPGAWSIRLRNGVIGIVASADVHFFFQALHYSCEDLEFARHRARQERIWNIKPPRREVCLNLDLRQTGLGGASCGPRPEAKHVFPVKPEKWTIWLKPYKKQTNE